MTNQLPFTCGGSRKYRLKVAPKNKEDVAASFACCTNVVSLQPFFTIFKLFSSFGGFNPIQVASLKVVISTHTHTYTNRKICTVVICMVLSFLHRKKKKKNHSRN